MKKKHSAFVLILVLALSHALPAACDSWSQINQAIEKKEGWEQIVDRSAFSLGESKKVAVENGRTYTERAFGTYPSIDGSTVMVPMALEFARQHLRLSDADLSGFVAFSTTHNAYLNLIQSQPNGFASLVTEEAVMDVTHPVDLMIGTKPSAEELALAEELGVTLVQKPLCYDAFVFITHVSNPIESLTLEQIRAIYSGEIESWEELGGHDWPMAAYQRDQNSGSQTAMVNMVMQDRPILSWQPVGAYLVDSMGKLIHKIGGYENAENGIGYTFKFYVDALYRDESIKVLSIDGVYPSEENIKSGAYPLTMQYVGVIRESDSENTGGLFLGWMLSEEGQRCMRQAGYLPAGDAERAGD